MRERLIQRRDFCLRLKENTFKSIKEFSKKNNKYVQQTIRESLREYLERHPIKKEKINVDTSFMYDKGPKKELLVGFNGKLYEEIFERAVEHNLSINYYLNIILEKIFKGKKK